jgi:hypothetical protein
MPATARTAASRLGRGFVARCTTEAATAVTTPELPRRVGDVPRPGRTYDALMFFRPRRLKDERLEAWQRFAERLGLEDAGDVAERLRRWLDLGEVGVSPLYALRRPDLPTLYLFDILRTLRGPAGEMTLRHSACLLRADEDFAPLSLRALPKQTKARELIEAGRTGSQVVPIDDAFDAEVTVFARDVPAAASLIRPPLRPVLSRALTERGPGVSLVLGERHALLSVESDEPPPLPTLELLLSDLLSLYAMLSAM